MPVDFNFILKNERLDRIFFHGVFFRRFSFFLDLLYAISSRLPLSVCLGL